LGWYSKATNNDKNQTERFTHNLKNLMIQKKVKPEIFLAALIRMK
jgi:hypothetical protein